MTHTGSLLCPRPPTTFLFLSFHEPKDSGPFETCHDTPRTRQRFFFSSTDCWEEWSLLLGYDAKQALCPFHSICFSAISIGKQLLNHNYKKIINLRSLESFQQHCLQSQMYSEPEYPNPILFPQHPALYLLPFSGSIHKVNYGM